MRLEFEDLSISLQVDRLPEIEDILLAIAQDIKCMKRELKEFVDSWENKEEDRENQEHMDLSQIQSAVERNTSVTQSAVMLIQQIAQQLQQNANDPGAIRALADQLNQSSQSLADAVTANTPADTGGSTGPS